jgi:hypothetical protein
MLPDDLNQPWRERHSASAAALLGNGLKLVCPPTLMTVRTDPETALIEIGRVNAQASCLSSPESSTACRGDDRAVPIGHDREQDGHQFLAGDDPLVGVVPAPWW